MIISNLNSLKRFNSSHSHAQIRSSALLVRVLSCFYYSTVMASFAVAYLSEERRFMWQSWYPVDYQHNVRLYYALLLFQLFASFLVSFIYSSLDLYAAVLYKVLGAHIDILQLRLSALGRPTQTDGGGDGGVSWTDDAASRRELAACVDYHCMCIE